MISTISRLYSDFRKTPRFEEAVGGPPIVGGALLMAGMGFDVERVPSLINIAASFCIWWKNRKRAVWRITPETAEYLKTVNLSFIPEVSPPGWWGDAVLMESIRPEKPFLRNIFSLACYLTKNSKGEERYFFVYLKYPDGGFSFSIASNQGKINRKLAESGELLEKQLIADGQLLGDYPPEMLDEVFDIVRFVFATSYYVNSPDKIRQTVEPGPPARNEKGKPIRERGNVVSLWTYNAMALNRPEYPHREETGPLDKSGLDLEPVIVAPHIRRQGDKIMIIEQYDSHRWKRPEKIASKTRI